MYFEIMALLVRPKQSLRVRRFVNWPDCGSSTAVHTGESSKVLPQSALPVVGYEESNCIGMGRTAG